MHSFSSFALSEKTVQALKELGYLNPSPVQLRVIPAALQGESLVCQSETGSGKTHAYLIPIVETLKQGASGPQSVIICPSRELSRQVYEFARELLAFFPGFKARLFTSEADKSDNAEGSEVPPDIVIGTPGRLFDLLGKEHLYQLKDVKTVVLDEADMLLELGYFEMIDQLTALFPEKRQTMVFSATIEGPLVPHIEKAIGARFSYFGESVKTASRVRHHFLDMRHVGKNEALRRFLELKRPYLCLVFASTKEGVRSCYEYLRANGVKCLLFSGELTDRERKRALKQLRTGEFPVIVCSDLLARGIDLPDVTDVVSLDLPSDLSYYYHRAGRSGRFGKEGDSYVFYDKGDSARAEELFAKGLQADFLALRKDGIWEDPVGFAPKRKLSGAKKPLPDDERREILIAKAKTRPGKVKPGYKRKRKLAIEKVKGKYRRKAISKAISKSKKEKGK